MSDYICPFTNVVCSPNCEYWKTDTTAITQRFLSRLIPFNISFEDITNYLTPRISESGRKWIPIILLQLRRYQGNFLPNNISNGYCTRLQQYMEGKSETS